VCLELEANLETLATCFLKTISVRGVVQSVEAIRYKPEGRVFISRWGHWHFSLT